MTGIAGALLLGWSLWLTGCAGGSPQSPTRVVTGLAFLDPSLVIGRNESAQVQLIASFGADSTLSVAGAAEWTTSDASVVQVSNGLVTAVGVGHATVQAVYQGRTASLNVTARRNTVFSGTATVSCCEPVPPSHVGLLGAVEALVDGTSIQREEPVDDTHGIPSITVAFAAVPVAPGHHELQLRAQRAGFVCACTPTEQPDSFTITAAPAPRLRIIDADTNEVLKELVLPLQTGTARASGGFSWPVDVPLFDR